MSDTITNNGIVFESNLGLIPLVNFSVVNAKHLIFRSGQPLHRKDYKWLHDNLDIEDIIDLRAESNDDEQKAPEFGIKVWKIPVVDGDAPSIDQGDTFISILRRLLEENRPALIHCEHGHGRTSTFCVLAQLVMGMGFEDAMNEEKVKYRYDFHHQEQIDFLKKYHKLRFDKT